MLEIEIKAYCDNHEDIIAKINSLGGEFIAALSERDIYYSHPCRDFAETDEAFRIRTENGRNILTYKGPKLGRKTKSRIEKETVFDDLDSMTGIVESLGFGRVEEVIKTRTVYRIRDIEICLDLVEGLGTFVELEKKGNDRESGEKELAAIAAGLGLSEFETRSYLELKLEKLQKK